MIKKISNLQTSLHTYDTQNLLGHFKTVHIKLMRYVYVETMIIWASDVNAITS